AGYMISGNSSYLKIATDNYIFLESSFMGESGFWHHTWKNGVATIPAFLDDLSYLIQASIQLQMVTGDLSYLI
ncbi:hypothetical protein ACTUQ0_15600, partial [Listeria monocytogenes]|uniref:hypothetical protein n=1 Tax=Listeria monocytogenes TaxID=1639 RepID=UPI003FA49FC9